jgi:hypothetical protein
MWVRQKIQAMLRQAHAALNREADDRPDLQQVKPGVAVWEVWMLGLRRDASELGGIARVLCVQRGHYAHPHGPSDARQLSGRVA